MAPFKISVAFSALPDDKLDNFAVDVQTGLTGNAISPTPFPLLVQLGKDITAYQTAMANQPTGGPPATQIKNDKRAALVATLRKLAHFVEDNANNDRAVILSTNFEITAVAGPARPVSVPGALTLSPGAEGELIGKVAAPVDRARGYLPRSRVFGTEAWTLHEPSNDSRAISIAPLVPGTKYEVQVAALGGSEDQSGFGDSAVGRAP